MNLGNILFRRTDFNEEEWKVIVEITKKVCNG